jgi:hypothetical protein
MALHTELPIYKHAYALLRLSLVGKRNMPRDFKNSLGSRIHDECIEILSLIADANQLPDAEREPVLADMLRHVDKVKFLLRVCNDERLITTRCGPQAIELLETLGHQGGGWLRSSQERRQSHEGQGFHARAPVESGLAPGSRGHGYAHHGHHRQRAGTVRRSRPADRRRSPSAGRRDKQAPTQFSRNNAYNQNFGNGNTNNNNKSWEGGRARPVRRFIRRAR